MLISGKTPTPKHFQPLFIAALHPSYGLFYNIPPASYWFTDEQTQLMHMHADPLDLLQSHIMHLWQAKILLD